MVPLFRVMAFSLFRMMAHENGGTMLSQAGLDKSAQPLPAMSPPTATMAGGVGGGEVPGVGDFLDETKDRVDQDPEATPFDDLRHYAYEGDGKLMHHYVYERDGKWMVKLFDWM